MFKLLSVIAPTIAVPIQALPLSVISYNPKNSLS